MERNRGPGMAGRKRPRPPLGMPLPVFPRSDMDWTVAGVDALDHMDSDGGDLDQLLAEMIQVDVVTEVHAQGRFGDLARLFGEDGGPDRPIMALRPPEVVLSATLGGNRREDALNGSEVLCHRLRQSLHVEVDADGDRNDDDEKDDRRDKDRAHAGPLPGEIGGDLLPLQCCR